MDATTDPTFFKCDERITVCVTTTYRCQTGLPKKVQLANVETRVHPGSLYRFAMRLRSSFQPLIRVTFRVKMLNEVRQAESSHC